MVEQLAGMDASFLSIESPELPMHVVGVMLIDPAAGANYSEQRLRQVIADRMHLMPPFNRSLVQVPLHLDRPYWHYNDEVDLSKHIFTATLKAPGDLHALGDFVGEISTKLIDRSGPLWELHVVDGFADGRVAVVAKIHHSSIYGAAGADFIAQLMDLDAVGRTDLPPKSAHGNDIPGIATLLGRAAVHQLHWPVAVTKVVGGMGRNAVTATKGIARIISRHGRDALPFTAPKAAISGAPTDRRIAAFGQISLKKAKDTKNAAKGTVNDVLLTIVTMAIRDYLEKRDDLPTRPLVVSVPVNAGDGKSEGTNQLGAMLVPLPMDESDPLALLHKIHDGTLEAKAFTLATGVGTIADLADVVPHAVVNIAGMLMSMVGTTSLQPNMQNLIVSNVMGPPIPVFMAGAKVDAVYPMGPLMPGAGMNITVLSNMDRLDVGIMACPDLVDDVWEIVDALPAALDKLHAAALSASTSAGSTA